MKNEFLSVNSSPISSIGLGGNIFGYVCNQLESKIIIDTAEDYGINFIDTADIYSNGLSEEIIGNALIRKRNQWVIASKVGIRSGGDGKGCGEKKKIFDCVENSLRRLKTDFIDIYQLHRYDQTTPVEETICAFEMLIKQGKIRCYGVSNFNVLQIKEFNNVSKSINCNYPYTHQVHYNLIKNSFETSFAKDVSLKKQKYLIYGALGRGVLTDKYISYNDKNNRANLSESVKGDLKPSLLKIIKNLTDLAKQQNITMAQLSILYVLRNKLVLSALIGVRNAKQLEEVASATAQSIDINFWNKVDELIGDKQKFNSISLGKPYIV
jgi:aryl-alcohol dehydrogenase-like predicted oxidoreductase